MKTKNVTEKNMKVCLVGSSGGHLTHLYMLKPFWKDKNRFWVTFDKEDARSLLEGEKVYPCYFPTNRSIKALIKNTKIAWDVLHKEKPDLIISCGAAVAVPFFYIGKTMGAKLIYIEVFDRIDKPTMTGKMVYPLLFSTMRIDDIFVRYLMQYEILLGQVTNEHTQKEVTDYIKKVYNPANKDRQIGFQLTRRPGRKYKEDDLTYNRNLLGHGDIEKAVSEEKIRQLSRSIMDVLWFSLWNKAE